MPKQSHDQARERLRNSIIIGQYQMGMQQSDIAERMGICQSCVSRLLSNLDRVSVPRLRTLIQMFDLDPVQVLLWLGYTDRDIRAINKEDSA